MTDLEIFNQEFKNATDRTDDYIAHLSNLPQKEKEKRQRAIKVCNTLNKDFLIELNSLSIWYPNVDAPILLKTLFSLMVKGDTKQDNQSYIDYLSNLIGFKIETSIDNLDSLFTIKFDENKNKILLQISKEANIEDYHNIFATTLADILCHYTNGENKNLSSSYATKEESSNSQSSFNINENMDKIRLDILDILNILDVENSNIKTKEESSEPLIHFSESSANIIIQKEEKAFFLAIA